MTETNNKGETKMELIKEALIIESNGLRTSCFIVENLPKDLLYHKAKKLQPMDEYSERLVPAFTLDENGKRHPTGEMIDELHPGIVMDGAGSGAFVFTMETDDSVQRLKAIDRHIEDTIKDPNLKPKRIPYASQPGVTMSAPVAYSQIVRVRLPDLASPHAAPTAESAGTLSAKPKRVLTPEQKQAYADRLAKARAAKAAKQQPTA